MEPISLGLEHQSLLNVDDCSIPPDLQKYFLGDDKNDNNLYFSSIDIKSAHNSLALTDNASHTLNLKILIKRLKTLERVGEADSVLNEDSFIETLWDLQIKKYAELNSSIIKHQSINNLKLRNS